MPRRLWITWLPFPGRIREGQISTETASFGAGKRENHDATSFYGRRMMTRVVDGALGSPIEPKLWRENTNINFSDQKMRARFGVTGPKGDGRVEVEAHNTGDDTPWVIDRLLLHLDDRDAPIDLLGEPFPGADEEEIEPADAA